MYGMVNKAVEEMVCMQHGEPAWEQIKAKAGVDVDVFMSNEGYPDEITYKLVAAASEVLQLPADQILEGFGEHWILHTAQEGYGGLMQAAGKSLPEFLKNLPNFHSRVSMIFPKLQPPGFQCSEITPTSVTMHYFSHRPGLAPFVTGLLHGLGKLFKTPVTVRMTESKIDGIGQDVFLVEWELPTAI
jgi:hypothetical protein